MNQQNPINFTSFELGDPIRVFINGSKKVGFFIAIQNNILLWGTRKDCQARLVFTPVSSILSIVKL